MISFKGITRLMLKSAVCVCLPAACLFSGCVTPSIGGSKPAPWRPKAQGREPALWANNGNSDVAALPRRKSAEPPAAPVSKPRPEPGAQDGSEERPSILKKQDKVAVYLRGIPTSEEIMGVVDHLGCVTLPLIGPTEIVGRTTSEAERLIERAYVEGGYYTSINVIVVTQEGKYFIEGEIQRPGEYSLGSQRTLLQAIAAAGGFTDFAKRSKVYICRKDERRRYDTRKIESLKSEDPIIKPGDRIQVGRTWF